ncbi:MAG: hypothetical protein AO394_07210 [Candidatus Fermentibacter daniensis]|nr:MAG: hypothetical protein AO394_07210 [Candidatus Fermentibacter daniensis]
MPDVTVLPRATDSLSVGGISRASIPLRLAAAATSLLPGPRRGTQIVLPFRVPGHPPERAAGEEPACTDGVDSESRKASHLVIIPASAECSSASMVRKGTPSMAVEKRWWMKESGPQPKFVR